MHRLLLLVAASALTLFLLIASFGLTIWYAIEAFRNHDGPESVLIFALVVVPGFLSVVVIGGASSQMMRYIRLHVLTDEDRKRFRISDK